MLLNKPLNYLKWLALAVLLATLGAGLFFHIGRILQAPAEAPVPADVIVVLGGDDGERGLTGARLYRAGFAPRVVLTGVGSLETQAPDDRNWLVSKVMQAGIPSARLEYDIASRNTQEEAVNTRKLMAARGWRSVLVVSDPFHMRRLSLTWERVFRGSGLHYRLVATARPSWHPAVWWRDRTSRDEVVMECMKFVYYVFRY